jgi:hypothetical protein
MNIYLTILKKLIKERLYPQGIGLGCGFIGVEATHVGSPS